MQVDRVRIEYYKGYHKEEVPLDAGVNLVVGANGAGKSALLEAISLRFENKPTRTRSSKPSKGFELKDESRVAVRIMFSEIEVKEMIQQQGRSWRFCVPVHGLDGKPVPADEIANALKERGFIAEWTCNHRGRSPRVERRKARSVSIPGFQRMGDRVYNFVSTEDGITHSGDVQTEDPDMGVDLAPSIMERFFLFRAERFRIGKCFLGTRNELEPDCSNLPEVLSNLQARPVRFRQFVHAVRTVLPDVKDITVRPASNQEVLVQVWFDDPQDDREDLAIDLDECGSGVSQVVAILCVALTSVDSRIICIDEPNSFLHPGAVRRLMAILAQEDRHQYVIATHAAEVIRAFPDAAVHVVNHEDGASRVSRIPGTVEDVNKLLGILGHDLSDLLGYDRTLWVEGRTETLSVPKLLDRNAWNSNTAVLALAETSIIDTRHARHAIESIRQLSALDGMFTNDAWVVLDREGKKTRELELLCQAGTPSLKFLKRRMFENYLIDGEAIAWLIHEETGRKLGVDDVAILLAKAQEEGQFLDAEGRRRVAGGRDWILEAHGKKLMDFLLSSLTENALIYRNTEHAPRLVEWLLHRGSPVIEGLSQEFVPWNS